MMGAWKRWAIVICKTHVIHILMMYSVRLSDELGDALEEYAKLYSITVSEAIRQAVSEMIEDELDMDAYRKAKSNFERNPETCTHEELGKKLGFIRCIMWSTPLMLRSQWSV